MHSSKQDALADDDALREVFGDPSDHDDNPVDGLADRLPATEEEAKDLYENRPDDLGQTGRHPDGKLASHDGGEIRFQIGKKEGKVVIDMGEPVRSVGLSKTQAKSRAGDLLNYARKIN